MILVDTSIWIDHIRSPDAYLLSRLSRHEVAMHPLVVGEVALGTMRGRDVVLRQLQKRPDAPVAFPFEVLTTIEHHGLHGSGLGYVAAHLLVSARLGNALTVWTRDRRLAEAARRLGVAHDPS